MEKVRQKEEDSWGLWTGSLDEELPEEACELQLNLGPDDEYEDVLVEEEREPGSLLGLLYSSRRPAGSACACIPLNSWHVRSCTSHFSKFNVSSNESHDTHDT